MDERKTKQTDQVPLTIVMVIEVCNQRTTSAWSTGCGEGIYQSNLKGPETSDRFRDPGPHTINQIVRILAARIIQSGMEYSKWSEFGMLTKLD